MSNIYEKSRLALKDARQTHKDIVSVDDVVEALYEISAKNVIWAKKVKLEL